MRVSKWGCNLAVRIPAKVVQELGLSEGDEVSITSASKNHFVLAKEERRQAALERIRTRQFYFPEGYKFDREEANSR